MIAKDLRQVYTNFDPLLPLSYDSEFYVERIKSPLAEMKWTLLNENQTPPKILFSGHRGSGKSTELNKLMSDKEMQSKYFIVHYSAREVLDIAGLDYTDLLLSIGAQIFKKAIEKKLKLKKGLFDELNRWRAFVEKEIMIDERAELGTEAGLNAFFIKILGKLKSEYINRERIRQIIEPRISELIENINLIINEVELKANQKVLVAIDDLDKPDLPVAHKLFYEHQSSLTLPKCIVIYTVPIALLYSSDASQITRIFTDRYFLPNITIKKRIDGSPDEDGRSIMRQFVLKRMSLDLIENEALEYAITISGGVFREMAHIIRKSCANSASRGNDIIEKQDIEVAESEMRNEFRQMLETEDYKALKEICGKRSLIGSDITAKLLHNLSILEYRNKENWCDLHPVIVPLIKEVD